MMRKILFLTWRLQIAPGQAVDITRTNAASFQASIPVQIQETTCDEASPSPTEVEEIEQNKYMHKRTTLRGEADEKKRERLEEDAMINRPGDIEQGEASERKPAASNFKKAGVGEGRIFTYNQEVGSRKLRATKKLDYPDDQPRRPRRENEETGVAPSDIARAGEALLATEPVQRAIAAALVANQNDSAVVDHNNQIVDQTELPSSITTPTRNNSALLRMQHKLLHRAQTRIPSTRAASAPSETDERYSGEEWDAGAVASGHGAGQAASTEDEPTECRVCLDVPATHIFLPCGHFFICKTCKSPYENGTEK